MGMLIMTHLMAMIAGMIIGVAIMALVMTAS